MTILTIFKEIFHGLPIKQPQPSHFDYWLCKKRVENSGRSAIDGCAIVVLAQAENKVEQGYLMSDRDQKARKFAASLLNRWTGNDVAFMLVAVKGSFLYVAQPDRQQQIIPWNQWKKKNFSESSRITYEESKKSLIILDTTTKKPESLESLARREQLTRL